MNSGESARKEPETGESVVGLEERGWLQRHCRGDPKAFRELLRAYRAPVYSYLVRTGVDSAARDDLFQEIFLKVHMAASVYQPHRPLRPWIFTIVANTVRNYIRARNTNRTVSMPAKLEELVDPQPAADRQLEVLQLVGWLENAIAALPLKQREVLVMTTIDGLRRQDVADVLHLPVNSVKTHLRRARLTLVKALMRRDEGTAGSGGNDAEL